MGIYSKIAVLILLKLYLRKYSSTYIRVTRMESVKLEKSPRIVSIFCCRVKKTRVSSSGKQSELTFSISATLCIRPSSSLRIAAACSSAESNYFIYQLSNNNSVHSHYLTIKALNSSWCSNFFTPKICWNMSYSCSLDNISSELSGCCIRDGRLESSSPTVNELMPDPIRAD